MILAASFGLLFWGVGAKLIHDWATDDNYSHGFLIVPLAGYFAWERRDQLRRIPLDPRSSGLLIVGGSLAVLIAGLLGAELFLTRIALIGTLAGGILFVLGWQHLKVLLFPLGILVLMIPLPAIIFNQIVFPLQLLASRVGEASLSAAGVPVLREGNVIILANTSLEVAEACSGIRSLVSLLTLGIVYGYFVDRRPGVRTAIALSSIPVAILANGLRVAGTGFAAHFFGSAAAQGFFHTFSGWLVFVFAFVLLFAVVRTLKWLFPSAPPMRPLSASAA
ncbi:MAG: exosortase A [Thermoanaerobaculia bacterium]